jgi:hypothetical protein
MTTTTSMTTEEDDADVDGELGAATDARGKRTIDLHRLLRGQQRKLLSDQREDHDVHEHPTALGDANEVNWADAIERFLPRRYVVSTKAFVIAADGNATPDQIDILIHDRHFCPLWFVDKAKSRYVPAESVFAAFEVKPKIDKGYVEYTAEKLRSVRELHRTSAPIVDKGEVKPPREPFDIIGGILAIESGWTPMFGNPFQRAITAQAAQYETRLDLGCAIGAGAFELVPQIEDVPAHIDTSEGDAVLMFFLLRLFGRLQAAGSPPAIDMHEYSKTLQVGRLELVNGVETQRPLTSSKTRCSTRSQSR